MIQRIPDREIKVTVALSQGNATPNKIDIQYFAPIFKRTRSQSVVASYVSMQQRVSCILFLHLHAYPWLLRTFARGIVIA